MLNYIQSITIILIKLSPYNPGWRNLITSFWSISNTIEYISSGQFTQKGHKFALKSPSFALRVSVSRLCGSSNLAQEMAKLSICLFSLYLVSQYFCCPRCFDTSISIHFQSVMEQCISPYNHLHSICSCSEFIMFSKSDLHFKFRPL